MSLSYTFGEELGESFGKERCDALGKTFGEELGDALGLELG